MLAAPFRSGSLPVRGLFAILPTWPTLIGYARLPTGAGRSSIESLNRAEVARLPGNRQQRLSVILACWMGVP
jgi:hypothetical protein